MSKKISINPDFFKLSGSKKNKKGKKLKPVFDKKKIKPNDIRKKLIQRVKEHQKKERDKQVEKETNNAKIFQNNFEETINYLESVVKKKKKKRKNKTLKSKTIRQNSQIKIQENPRPKIPIHPGPMEFNNTNNNSINAPPYGCLKGGNKPTYRQWRKTLKNKDKDTSIEVNDNIKKSLHGNINFNIEKEINKERIQKLEKIKHKIKKENKQKRKIKTKTIKRNILLGKIGGKVSVLVKNRKTRKKIQKEVNILKKKRIQEVKDYLRRHNLIKIGSNSPEYILRNMYEDAYLSGNILNKNSDILLHNWHKDNE